MSYEMSKIDPNFIRHELNIMPKAHLMKKWGRRSVAKHVDVVIEKVKKLKEASAIIVVLYPGWLSTIVVVKKKNGKWRMCVDFTSLN